jgi:hypothetical protein
MLRNENFILKMLSLFKIDRTQTRRQHHVSAEQSSPSWIAFVLKRHSLEFVVQHRNVFRYNFILVRRSQATLMGDCTGRIIYTREELDTWVREHMAALIQCGRLFNKDAYKECCKILKRFKAVGAIIPEDEEADMERLMNRFMLLSEEQGNTTLTNRTLFDGIQILIGDSDHVPAPSKATAQAPDESVGQGSRMEMLSLHLERIIAKAAVQGDETLTKRICREKLKAALGLSTLDRTDIDFINKEIPRIVRITSLCVEFMENDSDADSDAAQPNGTVTAPATAPTGARARRTCDADYHGVKRQQTAPPSPPPPPKRRRAAVWRP